MMGKHFNDYVPSGYGTTGFVVHTTRYNPYACTIFALLKAEKFS
ncbi:hypothetical protein [Bartonella senegalensis]|nr:hypothetical protein [Bartonella senegalensis]